MNNIIEPEVFDIFNKYSNYVVFWLVFFSFITLIRLTYDMYFNTDKPFDTNNTLQENKEN